MGTIRSQRYPAVLSSTGIPVARQPIQQSTILEACQVLFLPFLPSCIEAGF
jgi:hypothetical protein